MSDTVNKDPNNLSFMFDGVTAFKGWTTKEMLEQIRKENNDNPEDIGCDHNDRGCGDPHCWNNKDDI